MRRIILLLSSLALLVSCSSIPNVSQTPTVANSAAVTPSPSMPSSVPSASPAPEVSSLPSDFPFPSATPYSLYPIGIQLSDALDEKNFVVSDDGTAINYKPWHDFACRAEKNQDARLTVLIFHKEFDPIIPETQSKTHVQVARYELLNNNGQASWEDTTDSGNNRSGKLSFTYDEESGRHEILIGDKIVFEFSYFPPDPDKIARYYGYTPLEELPDIYTKEDAAADKCLVIVNGVIQNIEVFIQYMNDPGSAKPGGFIRVFSEDEEGVTITDISYKGRIDGNFDERVVVETDFSRLVSPPGDLYYTDIHDQTIIGIGGGFGADGFDSDGLYSLFLNHAGSQPEYIFRDLPSVKP